MKAISTEMYQIAERTTLYVGNEWSNNSEVLARTTEQDTPKDAEPSEEEKKFSSFLKSKFTPKHPSPRLLLSVRAQIHSHYNLPENQSFNIAQAAS